LISSLSVNSSPEQRELRSDERMLDDIAQRTGGRRLEPWDAQAADLFSRQGLTLTASPLPVWDILIPLLLGLILVDVAARRIAWDRESMRRMALAGADKVRQFTTVRKVETRQSLDALKRVRDESQEQKARPAPAATPAAPDPKAKFEAKGVEGDITNLVGGATDKALPPPPKKIEPKGIQPTPGSHMGGLMEAKRRAQQAIKDKEQKPPPP
jgi:hypothetical protein